MTTFVDTSALYALLDADDDHHPAAAAVADRLLGSPLLTHSFVLVETAALVQSRLGLEAVRVLVDDLLPPVDIAWVDQELYGRAQSSLLSTARRGLSLVDWTSFELMRTRQIDTAFAFDEDFVAQGFETLP